MAKPEPKQAKTLISKFSKCFSHSKTVYTSHALLAEINVKSSYGKFVFVCDGNPESKLRGILLAEQKGEIVFKKSKVGSLSFLLVCAVFVSAALFIDEMSSWLTVVTVVFFGFGGAFAFLGTWGQALITVSEDGITVGTRYALDPNMRKQLIPWSNFKKIEILEQNTGRGGTVRCIGIFAIDERRLESKSSHASRNINKVLTGWVEHPAALVPLAFTGIKVEDVFDAVSKYHSLYHRNPTLKPQRENEQCPKKMEKRRVSVYEEEKFIID